MWYTSYDLLNFYFYNILFFYNFLNYYYIRFLLFTREMFVQLAKKQIKILWRGINFFLPFLGILAHSASFKFVLNTDLFKLLSYFSICCFFVIFCTSLFYKICIFRKFDFFIFLCCFIFINFFYAVQSLIDFLFLLELYGIIYYFFFLEKLESSTQLDLIKLINLLYIYIWNSFLTTTLYSIGIYVTLRQFGSVLFTELSFFSYLDNSGVYFMLSALCLKLGLPLFHFYKIQLYQYLSKHTVILFSSLTTVFNIFFFFFLFSHPIFFNLMYKLKLFNYLLFGVFTFIFYLFKLSSLQMFICYSTVLTLNISLFLYLV